MKKLYIIGAGPGDTIYWTQRALELVKECDCVLTTRTLEETAQQVRPDIRECALGELTQAVRRLGAERTAILVSGDAQFFSVSSRAAGQLRGEFDIEIVNGISCMQYFCAKLGVEYGGMPVVSAHGREVPVEAYVSYNERVFVLTGGRNNAAEICRRLCELGLGQIDVYAGENLGGNRERIESGSAAELAQMRFCDRTVLLFHNRHPADPTVLPDDNAFLRGGPPMSKYETRALACALLNVRPGDCVADIGCGTGAMTVSLAYRASRGAVYAIDNNCEAARLTGVNKNALGAHNVHVICGDALETLKALPPMDCAFIGGGSPEIEDVLALLKRKNPRVRAVASAITVETLSAALGAMERLGYENIKAVQQSCARAAEAGNYHMLKANNPVFLISGGI